MKALRITVLALLLVIGGGYFVIVKKNQLGVFVI